MLKILNVKQVKELDKFTIEKKPITSIDLMEAACHAFVQWFAGKFAVSQRVGIICGTGNNGGDGLGIARLLTESGYHVDAWIVRDTVKESDDFLENLGKLPQAVQVVDIRKAPPSSFNACEVLID